LNGKSYVISGIISIKSLTCGEELEQDTKIDIKHEERAQTHFEDSQQPEEEVKEKSHMNAVFIGHVDPGKTTTQQMLEMKEVIQEACRSKSDVFLVDIAG